MGENHVRVYSSLLEHCQLIGIYDKNVERALAIAKDYGTTYFRDVEDLLQIVDAVTISVPTEYHYEMGLLCIKHNVHMLMEKPITSTVEQARDLINRSKKAGLQLQIGHIELFNPTIEVLKNIVRNEKVIAIDVHRLSPFDNRLVQVNVVHDLMIHDLYILYELLDDKIENLYALGKIFDNKIRHAMMIAQFKKGVISQVTASFKTEDKIRTIRIMAEDAFIQADLLNKTILISRSTNFFLNPIHANYKQQNIIEKVTVPQKEPLNIELLEFLKCVKSNTQPKVTGEDGLAVLAITEQISKQIYKQDKH